MVNVYPNPRPVIKIPTIEEMIVVNFIFVYQLIVHSSEMISMIPKKNPKFFGSIIFIIYKKFNSS